jgi:Tfp pilus assembly protein PilN
VHAVNLLPGYRILRRRVRNRIRIWAAVLSGWIIVLVASHSGIRFAWHDDSEELQAAILQADAEIMEVERLRAARTLAITEAQATLRARRAVSDQPDWGLLLATLASRMDQRGVLSTCLLEPAKVEMPRNTPDSGQRQIRPSRYTLSLSGLVRTQDSASAIAIALERTGLFERVTLKETRRSAFRGDEAVNFSLECAMADPAAEVP